MKKLKEYRVDADYYSSKASDIVRYLGLSGIVIIWIFRNSFQADETIPSVLITPLVLFVAGLLADLLQYVYSYLAWSCFCRWYECKGKSSEDEMMASSKINWPNIACFWIKIILILVGYYYLASYVFVR